jgi:hypothetical protein
VRGTHNAEQAVSAPPAYSAKGEKEVVPTVQGSQQRTTREEQAEAVRYPAELTGGAVRYPVEMPGQRL